MARRSSDTDRGDADRLARQLTWARTVVKASEVLAVSVDALAKELEVSTDTLRNWLRGRTWVDIAKLPVISEVLGIPVAEQLDALGLLPPGDLGSSLRAAELRAQRDRLAQQLYAVGPVGEIVTSALKEGRFKIEILPLFEGPSAYRVHVGDFVSFQSVDGSSIDADLIRGSSIGKALTQSGAARMMKPWLILPEEWKQGKKGEGQREVWLVPSLNVLRPPDPDADPLQSAIPASILLLTPHFSTWATDVASLVALAIGYGSVNTNLITRLAYGEWIRDPSYENERQRGLYLESVTTDYLTGLSGRFPSFRMVWAHTEARAFGPVLAHINARRSTEPFIFYLRPTERLMRYIETRPNRQVDTTELRDLNERVESALRLANYPSQVLDIGYPDDMETDRALDQATRDRFFARSLETAAVILSHLTDRKGTDLLGTPQPRLTEAPFEPFRRYLANCQLSARGSVELPSLEWTFS